MVPVFVLILSREKSASRVALCFAVLKRNKKIILSNKIFKRQQVLTSTRNLSRQILMRF